MFWTYLSTVIFWLAFLASVAFSIAGMIGPSAIAFLIQATSYVLPLMRPDDRRRNP